MEMMKSYDKKTTFSVAFERLGKVVIATFRL